MTTGIYAIKNLVNEKLYIGSSRNCERRFAEHRSRLVRGVHINAKLQSAWNKHGAEAFEFTLVASVLRADDLAEVEQSFLDEADVVRRGYNLAPTAGNTAGWKASPETRQRMSDAAKLRDNSVQVAAMAAANRGKKRPYYIRALLDQTGRVASAETRAKQSKSAIARSRYSQEQRAEMARRIDAGEGIRAVARAFGVGHGPLAKYVAQWREANAAST